MVRGLVTGRCEYSGYKAIRVRVVFPITQITPRSNAQEGVSSRASGMMMVIIVYVASNNSGANKWYDPQWSYQKSRFVGISLVENPCAQ